MNLYTNTEKDKLFYYVDIDDVDYLYEQGKDITSLTDDEFVALACETYTIEEYVAGFNNDSVPYPLSGYIRYI